MVELSWGLGSLNQTGFLSRQPFLSGRGLSCLGEQAENMLTQDSDTPAKPYI